MVKGFILVTLCTAATQAANLVGGTPGSYKPFFNGISYGSNDPKCYTKCQLGQTCTISNKNAFCKPYCGDGILVGPELGPKRCDDFNSIDRDGCTKCLVDRLWVCKGEPSTCDFDCGNGKLNTAVGEACDDGNLAASDGCSAICVVNPGWTCTKVQGQKSVCSPTCGDGKRLPLEMAARRCDDGNTQNGDGCDSTCNIENLFKCIGTPSICENMCTNGKLNLAVGEVCDDGNKIDNDGCSNSCTVTPGYTCTAVEGALSKCKRTQ